LKPLPEQFDIADPNEAYAAALLKNVRPLEPSATRKRQVWNALERVSLQRRRTRLSAPVVAGLLLFGATAASATMPHLWRRFQPAAVEVLPVAAESTALPRRTSHGARSAPKGKVESVLPEAPSSDTSEPAAALPSAPPPPVLHEVVPAAREPAPAVRKQAPAKSRAVAAEPVDPPASAALMVEALRERRAGNLARARELSSEYRLKYPAGALQEEALALSIEAAAALGDDEARRLSASYLQRYPQGRFRAQAQRVLGTPR
jgi:hypothetical protein